jgi:undecaprenyl-diphosphatase
MRKISKSVLIIISVILLIGGSYQFYMYKTNNFHVVTNNILYRSGQIRGDHFSYYEKKYHYKSILNLRGKRNLKHSKWYKDELEFCQKNNIKHLDYKISSTKFIHKKEIDKILNLMSELPKPILVHCFGGSDRSGLICACWKYKRENKYPKIAHKQLSIRYLHFPYFGNKSTAMDKSFWNYVKKSEK